MNGVIMARTIIDAMHTYGTPRNSHEQLLDVTASFLISLRRSRQGWNPLAPTRPCIRALNFDTIPDIRGAKAIRRTAWSSSTAISANVIGASPP